MPLWLFPFFQLLDFLLHPFPSLHIRSPGQLAVMWQPEQPWQPCLVVVLLPCDPQTTFLLAFLLTLPSFLVPFILSLHSFRVTYSVFVLRMQLQKLD